MYKNISKYLGIVSASNSLIPHRSNLLATAIGGMVKDRMRVMANIDINTDDNVKVTVLTYGHFMRCEFVMQVVREALTKLQSNNKIYRHEIKQLARRINAEIARMNSVMYNLINVENGRYVEGYDYVMDSFSEVIKPHYDKLYFSVLQAVTNQVYEPQIYAAIESAGLQSAMCDICMMANKKIFSNYSFIDSIYTYNTRNLTDLLSLLAQRVIAKLMIAKGDDINIKEHPNVRTSVDILKYKFTDGAIIIESLNRLMENNNENNCND